MTQRKRYKQTAGKTAREMDSIEQNDGEIRLGPLYQSALSEILRTYRGSEYTQDTGPVCMTRSELFRSCPQHETYMIAHRFEWWEINPPVDGFRCPNLSCRIVYIDGDAEGFYTLDSNGELTPYPLLQCGKRIQSADLAILINTP